jgi:hypothetical protein
MTSAPAPWIAMPAGYTGSHSHLARFLASWRKAIPFENQLDVMQVEAEDVMQPHDVVDDLGWQAMASI